ncbi:MAG: hypothetical protein IKX98_06145 [Clostridia bacterium]|nr:hypothetical protein [Clostridia bacterium]
MPMATTFFNRATLTYDGVTRQSNTVTGTIESGLTVTKTALTPDYTAGAEKTFVINLTNNAASDFEGLTLTDDLGAYAFEQTMLTPLTYAAGSVNYSVNGVQQAAPGVTAGPPLVFTGVSVPAGGNAAVIYKATVNQYAPLGSGAEITNTVTVTGGTMTAPVTASATITADDAPQLTITKSVNPAVVTENGQLTYTFVIENNGSTAADATDDVSVGDTFDPVLSSLTVQLNGAALTPTTDYTYASGVFATVPGVITVPAATQTQSPTGEWISIPGESVLTVTGTV